MITLYQDPIFGSQYYTEKLPNIKQPNVVPNELDFSLDKWKELIIQHTTPIVKNKNILRANKMDN